MLAVRCLSLSHVDILAVSFTGCEECCKHIQGDCPIHQSTAQPKLSYAIGSFPPEVRLCTSTIPEHIYGACAAKLMPRGTWIGPYEGRRVHLTRMRYDKDNTYVWEVSENVLVLC